jgi:pSer/pThr/pTyr-binding forkhead associated (FHA) protein
LSALTQQPPNESELSDTKLLSPLPAGVPMPDRGPRPQEGELTAPWRLLLQIENENRTTVGLPIGGRLNIGRTDSKGENSPDLDLTPYGAVQNGVSRLHASITYEDETLYIEDMQSTNGTRINGFQLIPGRKYRLRDGDELEFGRVRATLRLVRSSK